MTTKNLLEKLDSMSRAERRDTGPKFPGYWKGKDPASKAKSKMVGSAQESIIPEIHQQAKDGSIERRLKKNYNNFLQELDNPVELQRTTYLEPDSPKQEVPHDSYIRRNMNRLIDLLYADPNNPPTPEELARIKKAAGLPVSSTTPPQKTSMDVVRDIARSNKIENPNLIRIGQKIQLPDGRMYTVAKGDNLWNISRGKFRGSVPAFQDTLQEYGNAQDPNTQTTSPQQSNPAAQQQQQDKEKQDQRVDVASAKALASSIKPALPPTVDANTVASALTKINDQNSGRPAKPLTQPEQMAMGPLNALFARAAETPQTSTELATILRNVNTLMKKGKA